MVIRKVFKGVGGVFKAIGKIAGKVFKSKIFNIVTKALGFIPGLNAAGLIGKALRTLGTAGKIQKFLRTGLQVFSDLVKGRFRLGEGVKFLNVSPFHPLGKLGSLVRMAGGGSGKVSDPISSLASRSQHLSSILQTGRALLGSLRGSGLERLDAFPEDFLRELRGIEDTVSTWVDRVNDFRNRLEDVNQMLQEVLSLSKRLQAPPGGPPPFIIR